MTAVDRRKTARAFLSLARTQRRLAAQYREWAAEDAARGNVAAFQHDNAEARRLTGDAHGHLSQARNYAHG